MAAFFLRISYFFNVFMFVLKWKSFKKSSWRTTIICYDHSDPKSIQIQKNLSSFEKKFVRKIFKTLVMKTRKLFAEIVGLISKNVLVYFFILLFTLVNLKKKIFIEHKKFYLEKKSISLWFLRSNFVSEFFLSRQFSSPKCNLSMSKKIESWLFKAKVKASRA